MAFNYVTGSVDTSTNASLNYKITTGNILIVVVAAQTIVSGTIPEPSAVSYNGIDLTLAEARTLDPSGGNIFESLSVWYLLNPSNTVADIVPTFGTTPDYIITAAQFTGVDSYNASNYAHKFFFTTISASITSDADDLIIVAAHHYGGTQLFNDVSGQTKLNTTAGGGIVSAVYYKTGATTSTSVSAELTSSEEFGIIVGVSFTPASALFPNYHSIWGSTERARLSGAG